MGIVVVTVRKSGKSQESLQIIHLVSSRLPYYVLFINIQIVKLELGDQIPCEERDPRAASDVHLSLKARESFTHLSFNLLTEPFSFCLTIIFVSSAET